MAQIALFFAVFLLGISAISCQTEAEIKNQLFYAKAVSEAYEGFYNAVQQGGNDVDYYKDAINRLLPAIKSLRGLFTFAFTFYREGDARLYNLIEGFRFMSNQIQRIDFGLKELGDNGGSAYDESPALGWYKSKRAPIFEIEQHVRLFAAASSVEERRMYLANLRNGCSQTNAGQFLIEQTSRNSDVNMAMLSGNDRVRLMKWVKAITADAARSMTMNQICLSIRYPPVSQLQSDEETQNNFYRVISILDDLKIEGERIRQNWDQYMMPELNAVVQMHAGASDFHTKLFNYLTEKYNWANFGVYVLNSEFAKNIFRDPRQVIEINLGTKTILIFWADKKQQRDQQKEDTIKQYIASIPCPHPSSAVYFRSKTVLEIQEQVRELGATAVYVTDGDLSAIFLPMVSTRHRILCKGVEEWPVKRNWDYYRTIIVGY